MNWVKARATCTLRTVFKTMHERVEADVAEFNEHGNGDVFKVVDEAPDYFFVSLPGDHLRPPAAVKFQRTAQCIHVQSERTDVDFYVKLQWDDSTETCNLTVDGEPLELWQISKKALSRLFFS